MGLANRIRKTLGMCPSDCTVVQSDTKPGEHPACKECEHSIVVGVGNKHEEEVWVWNGVYRTKEQFDKVREIVEADDFDFSCVSNFFKPEGGDSTYRDWTFFTYFDKDHVIHGKKITPKGKVTMHFANGEEVDT